MHERVDLRRDVSLSFRSCFAADLALFYFGFLKFSDPFIFLEDKMLKAQTCTLTYAAWNSGDGSLCTNDAANHTCRISKNGSILSAAANSPVEIGYGLYALTLTASETNAETLTLSVTSSTAGVVIPPICAVFHDPDEFKADVSSIPANVWSVSGRTLTGTVDISPASVSSIQNGMASASVLDSVSQKVVSIETKCSSINTTCGSISTTCGSINAACGSISASCGTINSTCDSIETKCDSLADSSNAIQIRTNLIPDRPAAVGSAMTLTDAYAHLQTLNPHTIASEVLSFDISNVEAVSAVYSLCTVILAQLQSSVDGSSWTIYRTDGETQHTVRNVEAADDSMPITGVFAP